MIGLIQRVKSACVEVDGVTVGSINKGIVLLLGIERTDSQSEIEKLAKKVHHYRIFSDEHGKMNRSLQQVNGQLLVVSQFTLVAKTDKGNRPGFSLGASPEHGKHIYQHFIAHVNAHYGRCQEGQFGADMQLSLVNDGPVTFQFKI